MVFAGPLLAVALLPSVAWAWASGGHAGLAAGAHGPRLAARPPLRPRGGAAGLVAQGENWDWGLATANKRKGKTLRCIVTGGSSGVGEAICREVRARAECACASRACGFECECLDPCDARRVLAAGQTRGQGFRDWPQGGKSEANSRCGGGGRRVLRVRRRRRCRGG